MSLIDGANALNRQEKFKTKPDQIDWVNAVRHMGLYLNTLKIFYW